MSGYVHHSKRFGRHDDLPAVEPSYTLDRQVAEARREMGEARWNQLNRDWEDC